MPRDRSNPSSVVGSRIRALREERGWSQEQVGVAIGIDESSSRARISRYELGVHEPPVHTARRIANSLNAPLSFLYCEDDDVAILLLALHRIEPEIRRQTVRRFLTEILAER